MSNQQTIAALFLVLSVIIAVLGLVNGEVIIVFVAAIAADAAVAVLLARHRRGG